MGLRSRLWLAAIFHVTVGAAVASVVGQSGWLIFVAFAAISVAVSGSLVDQAVATLIVVAFCVTAMMLLMNTALGIHWLAATGSIAGMTAGRVTSAILDVGFGLKLRRL